MALGGYLLPAVSDDLLIASPVPTGGRSPDEVRREDQGIVGDASAVTPQGCHKSPRVEGSLCSIPWQDDFHRGNVPTVKDALRSIHWKLDVRIMLPAPRQKTPNISPIFKAHSNPPAISASKDGKSRQSTPGELTIEEAR